MPAIIGVIIAVIVIYLYCLVMKFLLGTLGPMLVPLIALAATFIAPIAYGLSVFRTFSGAGRRNLLLIPLVALLALVTLDFGAMESIAVLQLLPTDVAASIADVLWRAAVNDPLTRQLVLVTYSLLPDSGTTWQPLLIAATFKLALAIPLLMVVRGLSSTIEGPGQPAFRAYFYGEAPQDLRTVARESSNTMYQWFFTIVVGLFTVSLPAMIVVWPLVLLAYAGLAISALVGAVMLGGLLAVHAVTLFLIWAVAMAISGLLFCAERAVVLARSGYAKCPHAGCHAPVPLPVFNCPECGSQHDRLLPGRFGLFHRQCSCGASRLPTLFWNGKGRLPSLCPQCRNPMREELFGDNVHIPIYGGPSAGKTMFMMAATWQLTEGQVAEVEANLIDERDIRSYRTGWKPDFESGRLREKTTNTLPDAFLLAIRRASGLPVSLYLYDPAGEALTSSAELEGHRFMRYYDGLALLIDPLSLSSLNERLADSSDQRLPARTSQEDPLDVVNRVITALESHAGLSRTRGFGRRIAVVLTKADLPIVQQELGLPTGDAAPSNDWAAGGLARSHVIRDWLARNEPALISLLETRFTDIRFFAVSALGHSPEESGPFVPCEVMPPVMWLMSRRKVLVQPRLARIGGRLTEVVAVAAVAVCLLLPVWGITAWIWSVLSG